jgi:hypothetical protein
MEACAGACVQPGTCTAGSGVPDAPTHAVATAGNGLASVAWMPPAKTGGAAITGYTVTATPGGAKATTTGAANAVVNGLTNGDSYTFTVHATNSVGSGPESQASNAVTPVGAPGAPTGVHAQPANSAATVTWTAPADTGGAPITGYTVTVSPGGETMTTTGEPTLYFMGLTNGVAYTFTVHASNAAGVGPESQPSSPITPATVPGAPLNVSAIAGNAEATVTWTAPAADGGSPILSYLVTASPGGATANATGTTTASITGLTNGTSYTFTVVAVNALGDGTASAPSAPVTPASVPGAPTGVVAVASAGQAVVSWTAPDTGGSPITGYTVTSSLGGITATTTGATSVTVTGLTNWKIYTFTVLATNRIGNGPPSAASNAVIPEMVPGAPTGVVATPGNMQAMVSWTAPSSNGGSAITGYTVTVSPGNRTVTTTGATNVLVTGLTNGTACTFTVMAANAAGNGPASSPSAPVTPVNVPAAPTGVSATPGNGVATVTWAAPDTGGSPITGYTVTVSPGGQTQSVAGATTLVFTGLSNGQSYTFTVFATNAVGNGPPSASSPPVTPLTVPGTPRNVSASGGNAQAVITWTPPTSNGGAAITGYSVLSTPGSVKVTTMGGTTATMTGLVNGLGYSFTVAATNPAGTGPASAPSNLVVPFTVPGIPTQVFATGGVNQATVNWTAPASNGGSDITSYTVTESPDGTMVNVTSGTSATFTALATGATYTFTVYATNAAGNGAPSPATPPITTANLPGAPMGVTVTAGVRQATVAWTAAQDNGSAITNYVVTQSPGGAIMNTASTSATFTGLTNGGTYMYTVYAMNALGNGPSAMASVTLPALPGAPTITEVTGGDAQATVVWSAPTSDGNSPITSYTVTSSPGAFTDTVNPVKLSDTLMGLTNGTPYTFTVSATNAVGNGPPSAASVAVTPLTVPGAPRNVTATAAGVGQATITWSAPSSNGGSPVTSYTVIASQGSFTTTTTSTSTTISGLAAGSSYSFRVYATSAVGSGPAVASNTITLPNVPNTPGAPSAVIAPGAVQVSWMAPGDGGSPILGYTLYVVQTGAGISTSATNATVSGLAPGSYSFVVIATNAVGNSATSPASPVVVVVAPPSNLTYSANSPVYQIGTTITNDVPSSSGGPVAAYSISANLPTGLTFDTSTGVISGDPQAALDGADFTITATNSGGSTSTTIYITVNCHNGVAACNNACPDYSNDYYNCGGCGRACNGGTCCNGSCCGDSCCSGSCVNTWADAYNCGGCGIDCWVNILDHSCCSGVCCF